MHAVPTTFTGSMEAVQPVAMETIDPAALFRGALAIGDAWRLTESQLRVLLGDMPARTFARWKQNGAQRITRDMAERIGMLAGIFKALQIIYSSETQADTWPHRPNRHFGQQTPLQRMLGGSLLDLAAVRAYLDGAGRAPWS